MLNKTLLTYCCFLAVHCAHGKDYALPLPLTIYLQDPTYHSGTLHSDQGGVIKGEGFRLQARTLTYTKKLKEKNPEHFVLAEGDLLLNYHGQILLGESIEYDFLQKKGVILNAITSSGVWFIYAKKIILHPDHSLEAFQVTLTTSDNSYKTLTMNADRIHLTKDHYLSANTLSFKVCDFPVFWFPYFKADLTQKKDSPVHYSLTWDSGQGPKFSMRYRIYSYRHFNMYLRGDYHYARGPGGALEMDYLSEDKKNLFQSRNYLANDTFYNDNHPNKKRKRFRLQGLYEAHSQDDRGYLHLTYDRISDKNMPGDFKSEDFELNTAQDTHLITRYSHPSYIAGFNVRPRINSFQGFKQELPALNFFIKPIKLGPTPLILDNRFHISYLDYVYSSDIQGAPLPLAFVLKDFHALRAETHQKLYFPLHLGYLNFTPNAGFIGIAYNNSPLHESIYQTVADYGASLSTSLIKHFTFYKHTLKPYITYTGLHSPLHTSDKVYIFDIHDGYHRMNFFKVGIDNFLYRKENASFLPFLHCDLYGLGFVADQTFHLPFPKAGAYLQWLQPNLTFTADMRYNFNNHVLDFGNFSLYYTFNANFALYMEYRHRSRFDWRKDQHDNFILDVTRPISTLLDSPLSDGRNTFLSRAEIHLSPKWTLQLQTHSGWGRKNEPGYTEAKIDLITLLSSAWKLKLSYTHTTRGKNHLGLSLNLIQ